MNEHLSETSCSAYKSMQQLNTIVWEAKRVITSFLNIITDILNALPIFFHIMYLSYVWLKHMIN